MNLFICYTPLQLFIAKRIIEVLNLRKKDVEVFYISKVVKDSAIQLLQQLSSHADTINIIQMRFKYPVYFPRMYKIFSGKKYSAIYLASIDNILMQFIISRVNFDELFTFDDGTANIVKKSIYYKLGNYGYVERVLRKILNIQYTIDDVKSKSKLHYSIYNGLSNIHNNVIFIELMPSLSQSSGSVEVDNNECNVLIGSCYENLFEDANAKKQVLTQCASLLSKTGRPTIYIPHPRENTTGYTDGCWEILKPKNIAEIEILNLLKYYSFVHVYGFLSSCQLNLMHQKNIDNTMLLSNRIVSELRNAILDFQSIYNFDVINIDLEEKTESKKIK